MADYLQRMLDLALRRELQGIHFWASVYVVGVLAGSWWHVLRVRAWPHVEGQLLRLGVRPLGGPGLDTPDQLVVPAALYRYRVSGQAYEGQGLSVWPVAASGVLRGVVSGLPRQVQADADGRVRVYHHPTRPHKSLLVRPGAGSIAVLWALIVLTVGFYLWRW